MRLANRYCHLGLQLAPALLMGLAVGCAADPAASEGDEGPAQLSDTTTATDGATDATLSDAADALGEVQGDGGPDAPPTDADQVQDDGPAPDGVSGLDGLDGDGAGADDVVVPIDVAPDVPEVATGYPASELMLRIVSPSGRPYAAVIGGKTTVGGILFGEADTVTWQSSKGDSGPIQPGAFWRSGAIDLDTGDNVVTVTAAQGSKVVSDSIVITYNPAFRFDDDPLARPSILWSGTSTALVFTIPISLYPNFDSKTVTLHQVDPNGNPIATVGTMKDDGSTSSSGDEIESDGVFTMRKSFTCSGIDPLYFRVSTKVQQAASSFTAYSSVLRVDCVEHLTAADCQAHQLIVQQAAAQIDGGSTRDEVVAALQANPQVKNAGIASGDGYGIWLQFQSGVLGAVLLSPAGLRGSGEPAAPGLGILPPAELSVVGQNLIDIASKKALVLAPFANEFGTSEDGPSVAANLATSECPTFNLEGGAALQGSMASLDHLRDMARYGVTSWSTHGEVLFETLSVVDKAVLYRWDHMGSQEALWSGEQVKCDQLLQTNKTCTVSGSNPSGGCPPGTICVVTEGSGGSSSSGMCVDRTQVDLRLGRLIITNKGYAVTPAFIDAYAGRGYANSLVNLGACRTLYNGTMAAALFANGAQAITGFSDYVDSAWARDRIVEFFDGAVGGALIGQFHDGAEDPSHPGTFWRLFGAGNLSLSNAEIINASFETGDTTGWSTDGDGRVVSQLGASIPVEGKFMGLVSTGLGYTVQTGTLEQDFCIPADKNNVQLYWKFFSEEFKEYCGSQFQDTFQAVLLGGGGQLTVVDVRVDDLCGYGDASCGSCPNPTTCDMICMGGSGCQADPATGICAGTYNCSCGKYYVGLTPSDVSFDQGGVFNIIWQKATKNVKALAGAGKVTLRLYTSDTGDSIFDTVVLIDGIRFN